MAQHLINLGFALLAPGGLLVVWLGQRRLHNQVANGHKDPFRKDFDAAMNRIDGRFTELHGHLTQHGTDIRSLRVDVGDMRDEFRDGLRDVEDRVDALERARRIPQASGLD